MTRTEDRLRETLTYVADATRPSPDGLDRIASRGRGSHQLRRAAPALAAAAAVVAGLLVMAQLNVKDTPVDVADGTMGGTGAVTTATGPDWDELTLPEAIDALIAANETADPRPTPGPGEVVVDRTYAIWSSTTVDGGTATHQFELTLHEVRNASDGPTRIVREPIAVVPPSDDPDTLRDAAAAHLEGFDPRSVRRNAEASEVGSEHPGPGYDGGTWLDRLDRDSRGSAEPRPDTTEKPDQVKAFTNAAEALQSGLGPEWRIDVLQAIARLDANLVEYRGLMPDLLGRQGAAIVGFDDGIRTTLIFDTETADLLGALTEVTLESGLDALPITGYSAREVVVEEAAW